MLGRAASGPPVPRPWAPVVDGEDAAAALQCALELGRVIVARGLTELDHGVGSTDDATLSGGWAGMAVALHYLDEAFPGEGFAAASDQLLSAAVEAVSSHRMTVGLMQGFTGVAWAMAHLSTENDVTDIDDALSNMLERPGWLGEYDLVSGLVGLAVYGIERALAGQPALLELTIRKLIERAEDKPEGLAWFTRPELILASRSGRAPNGYYNFGMAHGAPGVIAVLADAITLDVAAGEARVALRGALGFLLAHRLPGGDAVWPFFIGDGVDVGPSRMAWCYGDPGISIALARAACVLREPESKGTQEEVLTAVLQRSRSMTAVSSAGLCHGSAGLALMFARHAIQLEREGFAGEARRWVRATLSMRSDDEPLGGYSVWEPGSDHDEGHVQGAGLLAGIAGVAVALVGCAGYKEPSWDRAFLLSGPPR